MEFQGKYLAIENLNLHQNLWKNLRKHWEPRDNCQQHIIYKWMDKQRE